MEETCVHHWVIAIPKGPHSLGKCKLCKEQRLFPNSVPDRVFGLTPYHLSQPKKKETTDK